MKETHFWPDGQPGAARQSMPGSRRPGRQILTLHRHELMDAFSPAVPEAYPMDYCLGLLGDGVVDGAGRRMRRRGLGRVRPTLW